MDLKTQHERFESWMTKHSAILFRVVNGFAEGDDRKDLMQEVMLAVWKSVPSFRGDAQPTTFLYRVSHNTALTWRRSQRNHRRRIDQAEDFPMTEISNPSDAHDDRLPRLYAAIRQLPELDRSLILLSLDGVSYHDMANIHGISESNVGVRLNRIKTQLTKTLNTKEQHEPR